MSKFVLLRETQKCPYVGLSNILDREHGWRKPAKGPHGKVVGAAVMDRELLFKVCKGIKAVEYNDSLKKELEQAALEYGLEESAGAYIVDNYITVLPEDARKGMIFLGEDSASYKAGNIKIDLKKAVIAGLEFVASISKPESVFNYIQLIIVSAFFIGLSAGRRPASPSPNRN